MKRLGLRYRQVSQVPAKAEAPIQQATQAAFQWEENGKNIMRLTSRPKSPSNVPS